jgi:hypothetical protein
MSASMSHNAIGLHGLLPGWLYILDCNNVQLRAKTCENVSNDSA